MGLTSTLHMFYTKLLSLPTLGVDWLADNLITSFKTAPICSKISNINLSVNSKRNRLWHKRLKIMETTVIVFTRNCLSYQRYLSYPQTLTKKIFNEENGSEISLILVLDWNNAIIPKPERCFRQTNLRIVLRFGEHITQLTWIQLLHYVPDSPRTVWVKQDQ